MLEFTWCGEPVRLLPQKAVFLPAHGALLVADVHVGKAHSFRRLGVPVPHGTTGETLERLDAAIDATRPARVVFLGDFLHSAQGRGAATLAQVGQWRARHAGTAMTLVRGNHDTRAGDPPADLHIDVVDEPLRLGPWALCHHPRAADGAYVLAGHLHPSVRVGRGFSRLRLPCFWFGTQVGVLPAFGAFTGTHPIDATPGDRVFALAEGEVRELPAASGAAL